MTGSNASRIRWRSKLLREGRIAPWAISQTTTARVCNVAVPSLETVINREVLWKSTITLKTTSTKKPLEDFLVNYGVTDALAPFPLHHLVNTMTATINNNIVSMNVRMTLPILLRLLDLQEFAKYNGMTPYYAWLHCRRLHFDKWWLPACWCHKSPFCCVYA